MSREKSGQAAQRHQSPGPPLVRQRAQRDPQGRKLAWGDTFKHKKFQNKGKI